MLGILQGWIVKICTAIFFITAVEMLLPDNKLKKYAKFVLGLILITIVINPIIMVFDRNFEITTYTNNAMKHFDEGVYNNNVEKYKDISVSNTIYNFKNNLETTCEKELKEKYPNNDYEVKAYVDYKEEDSKIAILKLEIGLKRNAVKKVKKIEIHTQSSSVEKSKEINTAETEKIKKFLLDEFNIKSDRILIYEL